MIIKGEKVILRPIRMSDAPRFVKWFNDPAVNRFVQSRVKNLKEEIRWIKNLKKDKNRHHFCIGALDGMHIGSVGLEIKSLKDRRAEFGIMIGDKKYWNQGLGSEASWLLIDYGFNKLRLHRIQLHVYGYNSRAIKVYKRLGFKHEGRKREHVFYRGKFHDTLVMGILDREWKRITSLKT